MRALREPRIAMAGRPLLSWRLASVAAVAAIALLLLVLAVSADDVPTADLWVARRIQEIDFPGWCQLLHAGEWLTNTRGGLLVCLMLAAGFWIGGLPNATVTIVVAPGIWVLKYVIEEFVSRPRPTADLVEVTQIGDGFSFPSGHITGGVAVYGMLAIIAVLSFGPRWAKAATIAVVAAVLVSSALSRVAFGAHWPSDVLGGLLLGLIWLIGLTIFYLALDRSGLVDYVPFARAWQRGGRS